MRGRVRIPSRLETAARRHADWRLHSRQSCAGEVRSRRGAEWDARACRRASALQAISRRGWLISRAAPGATRWGGEAGECVTTVPGAPWATRPFPSCTTMSWPAFTPWSTSRSRWGSAAPPPPPVGGAQAEEGLQLVLAAVAGAAADPAGLPHAAGRDRHLGADPLPVLPRSRSPSPAARVGRCRRRCAGGRACRRRRRPAGPGRRRCRSRPRPGPRQTRLSAKIGPRLAPIVAEPPAAVVVEDADAFSA